MDWPQHDKHNKFVFRCQSHLYFTQGNLYIAQIHFIQFV